MLPDEKINSYIQWGLEIDRVREILVTCRLNDKEIDKSERLIEATRSMKQAINYSNDFPGNDIRRFFTLGTAIALYCHLHCYGYVEFDRQVLLRMSKRYPRPLVGDILNSLGMLYQEHGRIDEAAQMYKRAIKILPTSHPRFDLLVSNIESLSKPSYKKSKS